VSGQFVRTFELITQGITLIISLITLWNDCPLKRTHELKFFVVSMLGFAVATGIIQEDLGMNRILHNTQWIVSQGVHVAVHVGLTMTLYVVICKLFTVFTNNLPLYSHRLADWHFELHLLGGRNMGAFMVMARFLGMLRRTMYYGSEYKFL